MGRRGDLLLQKGMAEYGCAEAGAKYEGPQGSKRMMESRLKAPKMLKDMLNNLATMVQQEEDRVVKLRTVDIYTQVGWCRLNQLKELHIDIDIYC